MVLNSDFKLSNFLLKQFLDIAVTIPVSDAQFHMCVDNIMGCINIIDLKFTGSIRENHRRDLWSILPLFAGKPCTIILSDSTTMLHLDPKNARVCKSDGSTIDLFEW